MVPRSDGKVPRLDRINLPSASAALSLPIDSAGASSLVSNNTQNPFVIVYYMSANTALPMGYLSSTKLKPLGPAGAGAFRR